MSTKRSRTKLDSSRCRAAGPHVAHDIMMLRDSWLHRGNSFAHTAWFIHCRSVMDFLDGRGDRDDDVLATDFFDDSVSWQAADTAVPKPADYEQYRNAVHKLAAHLTYTRIDYAMKDVYQPSKAIHDFLMGRCALFLRMLPFDRVAWFAGLGL